MMETATRNHEGKMRHISLENSYSIQSISPKMETEIKQNLLDIILKEYPESMKMLKKVEYSSSSFSARGYFQAQADWCYSGEKASPVNHFTAAEGIFSHNQLAYTYATQLFIDGRFSNVKPLVMSNLNSKKFNQMMLTNLQFSFHAPFESTSEYICNFDVKDHYLKQTRSGI